MSAAASAKPQKFSLDDFGINEGAIFDLIFPDPYPVGLNRAYPKEFIERVFAGAVSYKLGLNSLDYTRKRYLDNFQIDQKPQIKAQIETLLHAVGIFLELVREGERESEIAEHHFGLLLFDVYAYRAFDSIRAAALLSTHGFFGETMSVLRHVVEQLAWLSTVVTHKVPEQIYQIKAETTITTAKRIFPMIGELYGMLSEAAHFRAEQHVRHLSHEQERIAILRRSASFSAYGFCATVVCTGYLLNAVLGVINCQFASEKSKFELTIIHQYSAVIDYFKTAIGSSFVTRCIATSLPIDPNFSPWPRPIFAGTEKG